MQQHLNFFAEKLKKRREVGTFRSLQIGKGIDFWSNDYLGLARNPELQEFIKRKSNGVPTGATGSRLISGNSDLYEATEAFLANYHGAEAALLFNSGYDANLGLLGSMAAPGDTILYDELVHASIHDGMRLSRAHCLPFLHNNLEDLKAKALQAEGKVYIVTEGVFSMDGDLAPLKEICDLADEIAAAVIVDEAHSTGCFGIKGEGLVSELNLEDRVFARVHTFGKSLGTHGAAVLGSKVIREYLMNYARSFIFTTAAAPHSIVSIRCAYEFMAAKSDLRQNLLDNILFFKKATAHLPSKNLLITNSPIQGIIIPGNEACKQAAERLKSMGIQVKAIVFPTVPKGRERIRICLHAFNTREEIKRLVSCLEQELL